MAKAKRSATGRPIEEITAGDAFRNSMLFRVDRVADDGAPLWHGWVIMDAFLAGIDYARAQKPKITTRRSRPFVIEDGQ